MKSRVARYGFTLSVAIAALSAAVPAQACFWPFCGWGWWGGGYSTYYAPSYGYASYTPSYSYASYAPAYGPSCCPTSCCPTSCCDPCGGGCSVYGGGCATGACGVSYRAGGTTAECCQPSGNNQTFERRSNGDTNGPTPDQNFREPLREDTSPGDSASGGYEARRPAQKIEQKKEPAPTGDPANQGNQGDSGQDAAPGNPDEPEAGVGPQIPAFKSLENKIAEAQPVRERLAIRASFRNPVVARRTMDLNEGWVPVSSETRLVAR